MAAAPEIYFETDHYRGWPAVLVRLSQVNDEELTASLVRAWRVMAPKRMLAPARPQRRPKRAVRSAGQA